LHDQSVDVPDLALRVDFAEGEQMRTEISAKFREATVSRELATSGLHLAHWWTDAPGDFALSLALA
jgi:L-histidine Nalpha-methyltransferase